MCDFSRWCIELTFTYRLPWDSCNTMQGQEGVILGSSLLINLSNVNNSDPKSTQWWTILLLGNPGPRIGVRDYPLISIDHTLVILVHVFACLVHVSLCPVYCYMSFIWSIDFVLVWKNIAQVDCHFARILLIDMSYLILLLYIILLCYIYIYIFMHDVA